MAGIWHLSHHQFRDLNGAVQAGARAFFTHAETQAPLTTYQEYSLATPHPFPVVAK